uniref:WWC family member 3 n=2 Tax=Callorhinchus milii TaxID=7868 RepID=A0A4W3IL88_CALMI|eukprot:gi/632949010/ref/XP_007889911.1/ PREDICTED: protein WWC3 [Callorhinchus milii]
MPLFCRITKPLTFADCVGDELPLGWEIVYDPQVGVYYIDHINQITQIEDPRAQWRREQERMLKEYLVVAQEALNAKKEIYQVKQLRLELAQEEYQQLHDMCEDDRVSYVSSYSSSSSNTKYDPDQIKAEIAGRREALSRLKRELAQMKQELQYKEKGVETLQEIDRKMSNSQTNYKLGEAQEIMNELRTIKKSITSGEQERQDLIQSLARLTDEFRNSCYIGNSLQDLRTNAGLAVDCLSQQYSEASSQTDIIGEFSCGGRSKLPDKVRLSWQYEEAKKRVSSIQLQLAQLDNETWPGSAEADRDRLQLIKEKQALLQELQLISQQKRSPEELTRLEAEQKRLEDDIQLAQSIPHQELTERMLLQEKKNCLLKQLEEATRLTTYLNSQLKSLTASSLTVSSGSSRGSLASSCGSLASSRGSLSSVSFTDIYGLPQYETDNSTDLGSHLQFDFLPFDTVTKDHSYTEHCGLSNLNKPRRSFDPPQSLASLSSRSSLSSLSPPSSPLDTPYHSASRDSPLAQMNEEFEELVGRSESENLRLQAQAVCQDLQEAVSSQVTGASFGDMKFSQDIAPRLRPAVQGLGAVTMRSDSAIKASRRTRRVSAGLSDDSVATDSGVFEALNKRPEDIDEPLYDNNSVAVDPTQIKVGLVYDDRDERLIVHVLQLRNLAALQVKEGNKVYIRISLLPFDSNTAFTFCSKPLEFQALITYSESFPILVPASVLRLKSLQLDICSIDQQIQEDLLGFVQISLADFERPSEMLLQWYHVATFTRTGVQLQKNSSQFCGFLPVGKLTDSEMKDAVSMLLARTTAQLEAVEKQLEEERVKLGCTEEEIHEEMKEDKAEAVSERSWQAESVDSGCSNSAQLSPQYPAMEQLSAEDGNGAQLHEFAEQVSLFAAIRTRVPPMKVDKGTNTEEPFPEEIGIRPKERSSRRSRGSPFVRSSTIVRSQTFSPGARSQYVCRLYRSDSDSSTLPKRSPFIRNTLERRTLRYKQPSFKTPLVEHSTRTSLDLELDLQASRTRQRQLNEELNALRELKQRMEESRLRGQSDLPQWILRDERFKNLLKEAERQAKQTKSEQRQEQAAEKMLKKATKEVYQLRGNSQKEPLQVQSFREKMAFFTRTRINIPPLPADDV